MGKDERLIPLPTTKEVQLSTHEYPAAYSPINEEEGFSEQRSLREYFNVIYKRLPLILALAIVVVRFVPPEAGFLRSAWAKPLILCGEHSLEIFCLGVFLSFTAHFVLVEISARVWMQVAVSLAGVALMVALAGLMTWYKDLDRRARQPAA